MKFTKGAKDAIRVGAWQSAGSPRRRGEDEGEESSISISRLSVGGYNGLCEPGYNVAKMQLTLSAFSGRIYEIEILRDTSFAVSTHLVATCSIFIAQRQTSRLSARSNS